LINAESCAVAKVMSAKKEIPMLHDVVLHLARGGDYPEGSARHGYALTLPLDGEGHINAEAWQAERARCTVRRFWAGEPDRHGRLVHRPGGAGGATWLVDYDAASIDDEAGYRLGTHQFREGEYVSIRHDGEMYTFRVVEVKPLRSEHATVAA
jgi:hypothetical protein